MSADEIRRLADNSSFRAFVGEGEDLIGVTGKVKVILLAYAEMVKRCESVLSANSKDKKYRHKDADAALAYANYILKGAKDERK